MAKHIGQHIDLNYSGLEFGERLKFFRRNVLKMKRKAFSEKYDFSLMTLQSWENHGTGISKRSSEILKIKLHDDLKHLNVDWIFSGEGDPYQEIPLENNEDKNTNKDTENTTEYIIDTFFYEPLLKKNTHLTLIQTPLKDINVPSYIAHQDANDDMHFGILTMTTNKMYIINAFQNNFYKIALSTEDRVFLIQKIIFGTH